MRILVTSFQRSGTYLTCKMLERDLKIPHTNIHINHIEVTDRLVSFAHFKEGVINKDAVAVSNYYNEPVTKFLEVCGPDQIVATHLGPSFGQEEFLREMFEKIVYVQRDMRACLLSRFFWSETMDGSKGPFDQAAFLDFLRTTGVDYANLHRDVSKWSKQADEVYNYEDLVLLPKNRALKTPTDSHGKTPKLADFWTVQHEEAFRELRL